MVKNFIRRHCNYCGYNSKKKELLSLLDNGVFSSTKEIRDLLSGKNYRLVFENNTYGNCGWSGNAIFGFVGVLQAMSVQPGDEVKIAFDLQLGEAVLSFIEQDV